MRVYTKCKCTNIKLAVVVTVGMSRMADGELDLG